MEINDAEKIKKLVRKRYSSVAQEASKCCAPSASRTTKAEQLYTDEEREGLPDSVTGSAAGCGNPVALADLRPGEVVLDLGSGGGLDCFLACRKVGASGKVIGLDMTPDMISLARGNAQKMGVSNVEFRLGEMEHMPVETGSVDVVISNCVICLSPDKDAVFREAFRVLKPGGRFFISDNVLKAELPQEVKENLDEWSRCVAGALERETYLRKIRDAGFAGLEIIQETAASNPEGWRKNLASIKVKALKP